MDDQPILKTKKRLAEVQLSYRDVHGLNAREFRRAQELYHDFENASNNADWVVNLLEILDNVPEMFDVNPNNYDEVEELQLLIINNARIDKERSKQCFKSYTDFACYPKNYIPIPRRVELPLCIARISDPDFIINHGTSNNLFRFKDYNLPLLLKALRLPRMCKLKGRNKGWITNEELLLVGLYTWAHLDTQDCIARKFCVRGGDPKISLIFTYLTAHCYERLRSLFFDDNLGWFEHRISMYRHAFTDAIFDGGYFKPDNRAIGSIDTFAIYCCEPGRGPQERGHNAQRGQFINGFYGGNDSVNLIKVQAVTFPDGLIVHLFGPYAGAFGDARLCNESGINEYIDYYNEYWELPDNERMQIIGDSAYPSRPNIIKCTAVRPNAYCQALQKARVNVEMGFGGVELFGNRIKVQAKNKIMNKSDNSKPRGTVPHISYAMFFFLYNCHVCLQEGNISTTYSCIPPTINEWARIPPDGVVDPILFSDADDSNTKLTYTIQMPELQDEEVHDENEE